MKNIFKAFIILLLFTQVFAKDVVVLKNGKSFECWVTEYKEGRIYYVTKSDGITQETPLDSIKQICLLRSELPSKTQDANSPYNRLEAERQRQFEAFISNTKKHIDRVKKELQAVARGQIGFTRTKPDGEERYFPATSTGSISKSIHEKGSASRFSNPNDYYQGIVWQFEDVGTKTYWRKYFEDELKAMDKRLKETTLENYEPVILLDELEVGKIGKLEYPSNVVGITSGIIDARILQILSERDMLVSVFGQTVWVTGYATSGLVTDKHINLKGFFEITGTRTYDTTIGTNTVFLLQQISEE